MFTVFWMKLPNAISTSGLNIEREKEMEKEMEKEKGKMEYCNEGTLSVPAHLLTHFPLSISKLSNCRITKLSNQQIAELSNFPKADKSLCGHCFFRRIEFSAGKSPV
jgi:hypothetical protein